MDTSIEAVVARTRRARAEDLFMADLGKKLGVNLRRKSCVFTGLIGYSVVIAHCSREQVDEIWYRAQACNPIETPVLIFKLPEKECYRVRMGTRYWSCGAINASAYSARDMSIAEFVNGYRLKKTDEEMAWLH